MTIHHYRGALLVVSIDGGKYWERMEEFCRFISGKEDIYHFFKNPERIP